MPKTSRGGYPDFGRGQSILIKTGGVEMNFTHNGGDNIISLGFGGGNKFFLSNLVSGGGHCFEKKFRAARANICVFYSYISF